MSAEQDISLDEKRVYGSKAGSTSVFVATGVGLVRVECSGELVGEFGLAWRGTCRDVDSAGGLLVVATPDDVLVGPDFERTGFGPATAVGFHDGTLLAAGGGRVARHTDGEWVTVGDCPAVRAIDGPFVASEGGVFRVERDGLDHVGLSDARDVSSTGVPLVATESGLYRLGNGWMDALDGDFHLVASDGERAHAATGDALFTREGIDWSPVDVPVDGPVAGVGYDGSGTTHLVTRDGVFCIEREGQDSGWSTRSLGLPDVRALAVLGRSL